MECEWMRKDVIDFWISEEREKKIWISNFGSTLESENTWCVMSHDYFFTLSFNCISIGSVPNVSMAWDKIVFCLTKFENDLVGSKKWLGYSLV
jgi:hypothetical protein